MPAEKTTPPNLNLIIAYDLPLIHPKPFCRRADEVLT